MNRAELALVHVASDTAARDRASSHAPRLEAWACVHSTAATTGHRYCARIRRTVRRRERCPTTGIDGTGRCPWFHHQPGGARVAVEDPEALQGLMDGALLNRGRLDDGQACCERLELARAMASLPTDLLRVIEAWERWENAAAVRRELGLGPAGYQRLVQRLRRALGRFLER